MIVSLCILDCCPSNSDKIPYLTQSLHFYTGWQSVCSCLSFDKQSVKCLSDAKHNFYGVEDWETEEDDSWFAESASEFKGKIPCPCESYYSNPQKDKNIKKEGWILLWQTSKQLYLSCGGEELWAVFYVEQTKIWTKIIVHHFTEPFVVVFSDRHDKRADFEVISDAW